MKKQLFRALLAFVCLANSNYSNAISIKELQEAPHNLHKDFLGWTTYMRNRFPEDVLQSDVIFEINDGYYSYETTILAPKIALEYLVVIGDQYSKDLPRRISISDPQLLRELGIPLMHETALSLDDDKRWSVQSEEASKKKNFKYRYCEEAGCLVLRVYTAQGKVLEIEWIYESD